VCEERAELSGKTEDLNIYIYDFMMHDVCEERAELSGKTEDLNIKIEKERL
jgi:hypothetical protein